MNNSNTVIVDAVSAHNNARVEETRAEGIRLIEEIKAEKVKIAGCQERIEQHRKEGEKLSKSVISEESIFGGSLPENANRETMIKTIEAANRAQQFNVEQQSKRLIDAIAAEQNAIKAIEERVAKKVEQLSQLAPKVVTVDQIVG